MSGIAATPATFDTGTKRNAAKAKPFLAQRWELAWEKPLEQWRQELNVKVMPVYMP